MRRVGMTEQRDWEELSKSLNDACPQEALGFCADCDHVWIKTKTSDRYREQSCNMPRPETPARAVPQLMKTAVDASR